MMAMDEQSAIEVAAVRALETADGARTLWTDADRAWASTTAAQAVGSQAAPADFVARRAHVAIGRLTPRAKLLARTLRGARWRPWVGVAIIVVAFMAGVAADRIGDAQRINILAPPVWLLLLWNLAVYAVLAAGFVVRYGEASMMGPLRRAVAGWAGRLPRPRLSRRDAADPQPDALVAFVQDWSAQSASLYAARAARVLHLAAAALAVGVLVGLYVRGLALEYRASWESTFLDAAQVRTLAAAMYAPGAWITGIAVPDVAQVDAMRMPASVNAAPWLHLIAATLAVVVVVPRLLLAAATGLIERYRATHFAVPLEQAYFRRLLRGLHGGHASLRIVPYSMTPDATARANLEALLVRAMGGNATVAVMPTVAYGEEEAFVHAPRGDGAPVALFNLAATPEAETHGAFLAALHEQMPPGEPLLALLDEAAWQARNGGDAVRLDARRALWRNLCDDYHCTPIFVDLAAPDFPAAEQALDAVLSAAA